MLGIAQSVFIFVFAKFSITFIGQIRTLYFVWSNIFSIICTALWHVQLFNNEIFWVSTGMNAGVKVKGNCTFFVAIKRSIWYVSGRMCTKSQQEMLDLDDPIVKHYIHNLYHTLILKFKYLMKTTFK